MVATTAPLAATSLSLFETKFSALFCIPYKDFLKYSLYKNFTNLPPIFHYDNSIKQFIYYQHPRSNCTAFCGENKDCLRSLQAYINLLTELIC